MPVMPNLSQEGTFASLPASSRTNISVPVETKPETRRVRESISHFSLCIGVELSNLFFIFF